MHDRSHRFPPRRRAEHASVHVDAAGGMHTVIFGRATLNGEATEYRIDIDPFGPGHFIAFTTPVMSVGGFTNGRTGRIVLLG
jgi:hypothetical protein